MMRNEKKATGGMKKRLLTLLMAGVMVAGSALPVMAAPAEEANKITVYLEAENTLANATTSQDVPPDVTVMQEPVKLEVDEGTTVLQAIMAAGLVPMKWNNSETDLIPCTGKESFFTALAATGTLENATQLSAANTYLYDEIETVKTKYYDPVKAYWEAEDNWDVFEEYYAFMDGWHTPQVQKAGYLTARDFNGYSGWMFTLDGIMNPDTENPHNPQTAYTVGTVLEDGQVIRVEWSNCGGWDMGFGIEVMDENMNMKALDPIVTRADKTELIKALAEANAAIAAGTTTKGELGNAYTNADNLLKDKNASQEECTTKAAALMAALS